MGVHELEGEHVGVQECVGGLVDVQEGDLLSDEQQEVAAEIETLVMEGVGRLQNLDDRHVENEHEGGKRI